jgi:diguanylate cyclase (GGDEF)-like protein/PAS domain S-box-containing protein
MQPSHHCLGPRTARPVPDAEPGWYRRVFDRLAMPLAVLEADDAGELAVAACNPAFAHRLGVAGAELTGHPVWDWIAEPDRALVRAGLEALHRGELSMLREECRMLSDRGPFSCIRQASLLNGHQLVLDFVDITDRREAERTLERLALHDPLTGVANRTLFHDRLEHALVDRNPAVAVLLIDLDGFKAVNDVHGHAAGDTVLVTAARRLQTCLRTHDTVGRLGGDEFAVILNGAFTRGSAQSLGPRARAVASRAAAALARPIRLDGAKVRVTASVGIALVREGSTPDLMLAEADAAMYTEKRRRARRPDAGRIPA